MKHSTKLFITVHGALFTAVQVAQCNISYWGLGAVGPGSIYAEVVKEMVQYVPLQLSIFGINAVFMKWCLGLRAIDFNSNKSALILARITSTLLYLCQLYVSSRSPSLNSWFGFRYYLQKLVFTVIFAKG